MDKFFNLEAGISEILKTAKQVENESILAAVYGNSLSGAAAVVEKTNLMMISRNKYRRPEKKERPTVLKIWQKHHFSMIEVLAYSPKLSRDYLYLFHCPWERGDEAYAKVDPSNLTKNILRRDLNFNVGVYNPRWFSGINGDYDIVISYLRKSKLL